jgi:hypothetical protein
VSDLHIGVSLDEAREELNAVLASSAFARSPRLARLLTYLCTKYLAGEADQLKEYSIGVEVLDRPATFDPATDAGARVEVHRLRRRLQKFYESEGANRKLRIVIPVGHYVPTFVPNSLAAKSPDLPEDPGEGAPDSPERLLTGVVVSEPVGPGKKFRMFPVWVVAGTLIAGIGVVAWLVRKPSAPANPLVHSIPAAGVARTVVAPPLMGNTVRLACGRTVAYTDRGGRTWAADHYFEGGTPFDSPRQYFARTFDPKLFQSGRLGDFSYHIPLTKGNYELHLGFIETTYGPGMPSGGGEYSRTFDVKVNGRLVLEDFDVYSDANGTNIADIRVFKDISPARDGMLHLEFHGRRAPALVNTIEVVPAAPRRLNPIRLVAQENFVTLSNGTVWNPDTYVSGGQLAGHAVQVAGTEDPDLYAQERFGHFDYAIPVDRGVYSLSLYFAEEYFGPGNPGGGGPGSRVFDVFCNGTALLRNFDLFQEIGKNRACVKTFHGLTPNAQGKLIVSFVPVHNYASLYAIEVIDESQ